MNKLSPEVSAWYQDLPSGALFEVVALDEDAGTIEYQHVDGEVGEYDLLTWKLLTLAHAQAPEDWRSPYELNQEDSTDTDQVFVPDNLSGVLTDLEPERFEIEDDFPNL